MNYLTPGHKLTEKQLRLITDTANLVTDGWAELPPVDPHPKGGVVRYVNVMRGGHCFGFLNEIISRGESYFEVSKDMGLLP